MTQQFVKDLLAFEAVSLDIETPRQVVLREKVRKSGKDEGQQGVRASRITLHYVCAGGQLGDLCRRRWTTGGNKADLALRLVASEGCLWARGAEGAAEWAV